MPTGPSRTLPNGPRRSMANATTAHARRQPPGLPRAPARTLAPAAASARTPARAPARRPAAQPDPEHLLCPTLGGTHQPSALATPVPTRSPARPRARRGGHLRGTPPPRAQGPTRATAPPPVCQRERQTTPPGDKRRATRRSTPSTFRTARCQQNRQRRTVAGQGPMCWRTQRRARQDRAAPGNTELQPVTIASAGRRLTRDHRNHL
mmetsp:Transcript_76541/g.219579  ORF Transcript_76541/g.219579 Transcript_76541/m.219579 type:complete len:207 (-) Transcript_76541:123-743(-)